MDLLKSARAPPAACSSSEQAELWSWTNYEWPNKKQWDCEGCDIWAFSFKLLHAPNCFDLTLACTWGWYLHQLTQVAKQQGLASLSKTRMTQRWRVLLTHSLQMLSDFHRCSSYSIVMDCWYDWNWFDEGIAASLSLLLRSTCWSEWH